MSDQPDLFGSLEVADDWHLFLRIREVTDDPKVLSICKMLNVRFVGQLTRTSAYDVLRFPGYGEKTLSRINEMLRNLGFELNSEEPVWGELSPDEIEDNFGHLIRQASLFFAQERRPHDIEGLEDEISSLLAVASSARDAEIVAKRLGWEGAEPATLEAIGYQCGGVTRERVRQICAKYERRVAARTWHLPALTNALALMQAAAPCSASEMMSELVTRGISRGRIGLSGIFEMARVTGRSLRITRAEGAYSGLIVPSSQKRLPAKIMTAARRNVSRSGLATYDQVAYELQRAAVGDISPMTIKDVVSLDESFCELDADRGWFYIFTARNRLLNTLRKIFAVAGEVHVTEIRLALQKVRRLTGFAPPQRVLLALAGKLPEFEVHGSFICLAQGFDFSSHLEGEERRMHKVLAAHNGLMDRISLEKECMAAGMNPITFNIYLHSSPILLKLGKGVFGLIGLDVSSGDVASLELRGPMVEVVRDFGWTPEGHMRIEYCVTQNMIYTGFFPVPSQVRDYLYGEFKLVDGEGSDLGRIKIGSQNGWSLRRLFLLLGGEQGDPFSITFMLKDMRAVIEFDRERPDE